MMAGSLSCVVYVVSRWQLESLGNILTNSGWTEVWLSRPESVWVRSQLQNHFER